MLASLHLFHATVSPAFFFFFFFNDTETTEIYTLSLHDARPISVTLQENPAEILAIVISQELRVPRPGGFRQFAAQDRKSTRLNSSHVRISYAVFCLKKNTQPRQSCDRTQPQVNQHAPARPCCVS